VKVLVAEDSRTIQLLLRVLLRSLGHESVIVDDGRAALRALERSGFAAVITDWMMPEGTGLDVCRAIRRREAASLESRRTLAYTYVILLTSLGGLDNYLEGMNAGADEFLTKPFDRDQLTARLSVAERIAKLQGNVVQRSSALPICAFCKKIRDGEATTPGGKASWVPLEAYVANPTRAFFSHGVCPGCQEQRLQPRS
jgi:DNA-binding response OmpR family regulator